MISIPLTQGKVALVDDCDAGQIARKWYAAHIGKIWYAQRRATAAERRAGRPWTLLLHREILGLVDPQFQADHRDGNGLNCRRVNLRACSCSENTRNQRITRANQSGFKGVFWNRHRHYWVATITRNGCQRFIGRFATIKDAARAYDFASRELHGAFATLNFPTLGERSAITGRVVLFSEDHS